MSDWDMDTARRLLKMEPGQTIRISQAMIWGGERTFKNGAIWRSSGMIRRWIDFVEKCQAGYKPTSDEEQHAIWQAQTLLTYWNEWAQRCQNGYDATSDEVERMQELYQKFTETGVIE